jgi:hypothetical protein
MVALVKLRPHDPAACPYLTHLCAGDVAGNAVTPSGPAVQLTLPRWKLSLVIVAVCTAVGIATLVLVLGAKEQHTRRRIANHAPAEGEATVFITDASAFHSCKVHEGKSGLQGFEVDGMLPRPTGGVRGPPKRPPDPRL